MIAAICPPLHTHTHRDTHICMHAHMHTHACTCVRTHTPTCMNTCAMHVPTHMHTCTQACTHMHLHACTHACTRVPACLHAGMHTYAHTCMYTRTHAHTCMHAHTCTLFRFCKQACPNREILLSDFPCCITHIGKGWGKTTFQATCSLHFHPYLPEILRGFCCSVTLIRCTEASSCGHLNARPCCRCGSQFLHVKTSLKLSEC